MNQKLKNQVISHFAEDWGVSSPQFSVCEKIFNYLLSRPKNQLKHLTHGSLKVAIGEYRSDVDVLKAIQYLCGDRVPVLSLHFELVDDQDNYLPLKDADIRDAKKTGKLVHPETGEYVENFEDKVLMYFTPSSLVQEVINGA
ncbi:conserved hypothetical protein [Crenothrix polyspora]|uniref:Uncharacterized protein n=1 Tax=Crenothrix polyspora TaxID=360316 RepID=A0A1R4H5L7_9GAMM|nr:hypothetical protein [Crenothrix polyspora]SJM91467.1 conserved hypothetical protein [Crenothrix polyspora]